MRAALVVLVVVLGCRGDAQRGAAPASTSPTLAEAEAFERGAGVARDYTRAAQIYRELCREGQGDVEACRRLIDAIGEARGMKSERQRLIDLFTSVCIGTGDPRSCAMAMFIWFGRDKPKTHLSRLIERQLGRIDAEHFDERCEAGEPRPCEAFLVIDGMFVGGDRSGGAEERAEAAHRVLCADGQVESCTELIEDVTACGEQADPQPCVERIVYDWEQYDFELPQRTALEKLRGWCKAGDARACKALPGQAIDRKVLCDAHDYGACAELGCLGDEAAAKLAALYGADDDCRSVMYRAAPDPDDDDAPAAARLVAGPPLASVTPSDRPPFDSLRFRQLAIRDKSGWPRFEVQNLGKRPVTYVTVVIYVYDAAGQQLARSWPEGASLGTLAPGATARLELHGFDGGYTAGPDAAVTYEVCYERIGFERDSWDYRTRCPMRKQRGARWGDGNARKIIAVNALMPTGVFERRDAQTPYAFDQRHADAFEAVHPEVVIDVREAHPRISRGYGDPALVWSSTDGTEDARTERVPLMVTPVAVIYHLDGVDGLRLSPLTLALIFQGDIKRWSDAAIARDNPGVTLPDLAIATRRGTTSRRDPFIRYLIKAAGARWRIGLDDRGWPDDGRGDHRPMERAADVLEQNGTISWVDLHVARAGKLQIARIKNRAGGFVEPSAAGASAAAAAVKVEGDLSFDPLDAPGAAAYPIVYPTYVVLDPARLDGSTWPWVVSYLVYLLGDAQASLAQDDLGALPPPLAAKAAAWVKRVQPQ